MSCDVEKMLEDNLSEEVYDFSEVCMPLRWPPLSCDKEKMLEDNLSEELLL